MAGPHAASVVLITGGGTGIGRGIALEFARQGAAVAVTGRRADRLAETASGVEAAGGTCLTVPGDVTSEADVAAAVAQVTARFGRLTTLVNNAGVIGTGGIAETTPAEWDRQFGVNVRGLFLMTRAAVPALIAAAPDTPGGSAIVIVSSVTGTRPYGNLLAYCATKAAANMMTECLALDLAEHPVRVNAVLPGVVRSELHRVTDAVPDYAAFLERSRQTHPLGRHGEPQDVAALVAFLASSAASWITGECVHVDGGRHATSLR